MKKEKKDILKKIIPESFDENGELKSWEKQLLEYEYSKDKIFLHPFVLDDNSDAFKFADITNKPIVINKTTIDKIKTKHDIDLLFLIDLNNIIKNPVFALDSKTQETSKIFVTEKTNSIGNPIIYILREDKKLATYKVNEVTSVYDKKNLQNLIDNTLEQGGKIYINPEKIKILEKLPYKLELEKKSKIKENIWAKKIGKDKGLGR